MIEAIKLIEDELEQMDKKLVEKAFYKKEFGQFGNESLIKLFFLGKDGRIVRDELMLLESEEEVLLKLKRKMEFRNE